MASSKRTQTRAPSDSELLRLFCALVDDYDRLCQSVPTVVTSFEIAPDKPIPDEERWHRIIRAMALRKFVLGTNDAVRADLVLAAFQRSLVNDEDRLSLSKWGQDFAAIGSRINVDEGTGRRIPIGEVLEDLIYGQFLHGDYDRWLRTSGRARLTLDLAVWIFSEDAEFYIRRLRTLIRVAEQEGRLVAGPVASELGIDIPLPTRFSTEPRRHRDADFLAAKLNRLEEPHVASINAYVDTIRNEIASTVAAEHRGALSDRVHVPYIDPDSGGIAARVLFVLESPARPAALGSTLLSADNDDETAKNIWCAYRDSGLPRSHGLHWNAVPWFVGTASKNAGVSGNQVRLGRQYLRRLIDLVPDLRVVIAMGNPARDSLTPMQDELEQRGIALLHVIHPSPRNYNTRAGSKDRVTETFREASRLAEIVEPRVEDSKRV